jgi:hypothetical protein
MAAQDGSRVYFTLNIFDRSFDAAPTAARNLLAIGQR